MTATTWIVLLVVLAVLVVVAGGFFLAGSRRRRPLPPPPPQPGVDYRPGVGDDAEEPRDTPVPGVATIELPPPGPEDTTPTSLTIEELERPALEVPEAPARRMVRLRARLARSQGPLGRGLLALLSRDSLDEDTWEEVEETLLQADLGVTPTSEIVTALRREVRVQGARTPDQMRALLRAALLTQVNPAMDRSLRLSTDDDRPAVLLVVGVNGTGKTTTCGKLARLLVADGRSVVLGAADTFRAAASDQLQTWGERVGAEVVRGPEGADPASVAFDAVRTALDDGADVCVVDTAGRLHTKQGLMDELDKVKRVIEKRSPVDEVLLVLDATTGQNGMVQARVFGEVVDVTGIVLTKLDGSAKGGIIVAVQRELGVPVKLVGLGEGPDDLAPFDPEAFVDAIVSGGA